MKAWNKRQKIIASICGLIGISAGVLLQAIPHPIIQFTSVLFIPWGIYYFVRGTWQNYDNTNGAEV